VAVPHLYNRGWMSARTPGRLLRLRHALEYAAVAALAVVLKALPRRLALALGAAIGQLGWWARIRRRLVLANLARALPEAADAERRRVGARAARNFGRTVAEFLRFAGADRERVLELVEIEGLDVLREALAEGRGAVVVTGHLGAWALYVTALGAAGIPSALLVGVQTNRRVDELILSIPGGAVQFISKAKTAPREILKALRANKAIVMVADHYSSDQQVYVPFLGHPAFTLPLPGSLVARHRLPLLAMAGHRTSGGRHRLELGRIELPAAGDVDALRLEVAARFNQRLGEAVLRHPDQYFWYHGRWKVRPRESPPRLVAVTRSPRPRS